jgi:hypothetical protein
MTNPSTRDALQRRADELEAKAAENALVSNLASDPQTRANNAKLASSLRALADQLRRVKQLPTQDKIDGAG